MSTAETGADLSGATVTKNMAKAVSAILVTGQSRKLTPNESPEPGACRSIEDRPGFAGVPFVHRVPALLTVFCVWGDDLLRVLRITLPAVRIGGGILLMLMAIQMVFGSEGGLFDDPKPEHHHGDIAVFPIAMPVVAGPGTITAVVILMSHHQPLPAQLVVFAMLLAVLLLTFVLFLIAGTLEAMIGETAMTLITGVMGILLMALAAEFVVQGLRDSLFR